MIWSVDTKKARALSDPMADALSPVWDLNGRYLYFLASTNVALGSGWANTSSQQARPTFAAYLTILRKDDPNPFPLKTDEEPDSTIRTEKKDTSKSKLVRIDWEQLDRRIIAMPIPVANMTACWPAPKGSVFITTGQTISKYIIDTRRWKKC